MDSTSSRHADPSGRDDRQGDGSSFVRSRRQHGLRRLARAVTLIVFFIAGPSLAIDWEKLVMPGPLAQDHAEYESDCAACHKAFDVEAQRALCLACHKEIAEDLARPGPDDIGFHGRNPLASSGACRSCHPDHIGRAADIRGASEATFDHAETDYPLLGAHQSTPCGQCHPADTPRREAPSECVACHREDDAHDGALASDCSECHGETEWKTTRFDHDKTRHPLVGAHQQASCVGCHVGGRYKDTPTDCIACHAIDDAHAGRFGNACADCHKPESWKKEEGFDHEKKSGFALAGAHGRTTCGTCHRQAPGKRKLPETCTGCHASEDVHAGRFGDQCGDCHRPEEWSRVSFDHAKKTEFPLRGAHKDTACSSCHAGPRKPNQKTDRACISCHRSDDVHRGNLGQDCAECHTEKSFTDRIAFDHDLTRLPLLGLHAMVACESCHPSASFEQDDVSCVACHAEDDVHENTLGNRCEQCHNPNGWPVWRFDHGQQTNFRLDGAHEDLKCAACHRQPMTRAFRMPQDCAGCHAKEDIHRGGFGRDCGNCHRAKAWKPASLGRSGGTRR